MKTEIMVNRFYALWDIFDRISFSIKDGGKALNTNSYNTAKSALRELYTNGLLTIEQNKPASISDHK